MKHPLLVAVPLLALVALTAASWAMPGINLAWNNCPSGPGSTSMMPFDCNDNTTAFPLVGSFVPPDGVNQFLAAGATMDVMFASGQEPDWWRLGIGECRDIGAIAQIPSGMAGCTNPWGNALFGFQFTSPYQGDRARLDVIGARPSPAVALSSAREYYAFRVVILSAHTTDADPPACAGCLESACILLTHMTLYQTVGAGDFTLSNPLVSNLATWQCAYVTIADPGGIIGCQAASCPVRARRATWGSVRSLYR